MKILIAADGSTYTAKATKHVAGHPEWFQDNPEIHLLNVQLPVASNKARRVLGDDAVNNYYDTEAKAALAPAEKILRKKDIAFRSTYLIGQIAEEIQGYVKKNKIDMIVMGSHGHGSFQNLVMGSVATKVLAATTVPVLIIR